MKNQKYIQDGDNGLVIISLSPSGEQSLEITCQNVEVQLNTAGAITVYIHRPLRTERFNPCNDIELYSLFGDKCNIFCRTQHQTQTRLYFYKDKQIMRVKYTECTTEHLLELEFE